MSITNPVLGFFGASGSYVLAQVSDNMPSPAKAWFEGGAYIGFVSFLLFALHTVWRANQSLGDKLGALEKECREDQAERNRELVAALDRFSNSQK